MRSLSTFALAAALLSQYTDALALQKRTQGPPKVVGFPVQRKSVPNPLARDRLRRRSETVQASLDNQVGTACEVGAGPLLTNPRKHCTLPMELWEHHHKAFGYISILAAVISG